MKANDLRNFDFRKISSGCYKVTYKHNIKGDYYVSNINDMTLIDATLHSDYAKLSDIEHLAYLIRRDGTHYNINNFIIRKTV